MLYFVKLTRSEALYISCTVFHENSFAQQHNISVSLDTHILTLSVAAIAAPAETSSRATAT